MFKSLLRATALATIVSGPSFAQEMVYPDTLIILDVSNSMWGQIDGIPKISIAKNVIGKLVDKLDTDSEFGLMAFGHRHKSDCNDIELVLPIGPLDATRFSGALDKLTPHGRTPLAGALKQAAQIMHSDTRSARIILISDGIESCEGDPVALSAELEKTGLDFTTHVIGFNVAELANQDQLGAIAKNTGGLYLTAESTSELKDALETMMMDEESDTPMDKMTGNPQKAVVSAPKSVLPNTRFSVDWTGPAADGDYVALVAAGSDGTVLESQASMADGWPAMLTSPETGGEFEVRYISGADGSILASDTVTVQGK